MKSQEKILSSLNFRNSMSREETQQGERYEQSDPVSTAALWSVSCLTDEWTPKVSEKPESKRMYQSESM